MENILLTLLTIIVIVIISSVIVMISSVIALIPNYKYYKSTYKKLPNLTFNKACNYTFNQVTTDSRNIIWFANKNDFKIGPSTYIHNQAYTYFNPYALYWFIKYKKWFNKNCKHLKKEIS